MLISLLLLVMAQAAAPTPAAVPAPSSIAAPDTRSMTLAEVREFNAPLDKGHPYFIRCRAIEVTGSLAKKGRVCRTVAEWRQLQDDGNEHARAIVDYSRSRSNGQ